MGLHKFCTTTDSKIAKLFAKFPSVPVSSADANSDAQAEDGAVNNAEILAISATSPGKSNSISGADSDSFPGSGTDTKRPGSSAEANSAGRAMDGAINVSETKTETDTTPKSAKSNAKSAGGSFDRPGSGSLANALGGAAARNGTKNKERCNDEDTH